MLSGCSSQARKLIASYSQAGRRVFANRSQATRNLQAGRIGRDSKVASEFDGRVDLRGSFFWSNHFCSIVM